MFTVDNNTAVSSNVNRLEGDKIHDVKFVGAEATTVGSETTFDVIKLVFENEDGSHEHTIFEPKGKDIAVRQENNFGGQNPSQVEELQAVIRHFIAALNPDLNAKIEKGEKTLSAKTWNELRKVVVDAVNKGKGKEVQLKLEKDAKGYARVPGFVTSISKNGSLYMRTSFIGDKLTFSVKELEKMKKRANSAPTDMSSVASKATGESNDDLNDIDLSSLD